MLGDQCVRALVAVGIAAPLFAAVAVAPQPVLACGGCFHEPPAATQSVSVVTDHRMVFSVSEARSTLWDQIRYSGDPNEFVWVLPVADANTLEIGVADNNFVNALDQFSAPEIHDATVYCPGTYGGSSAGVGCSGVAAQAGDAASGDAGAGSQNTRIMRDGEAVVGPYQVAVVSTENGNMRLDQWLEANGFVVPDSTRPIIDYYVGLQFDFIVMRLRPGYGVQQMQPIRVSTRGYSPALPLRMIAAGIGDKVGLTLMVVANTRMEVEGFGNAVIEANKLTWDRTRNQSNYEDVFTQAVSSFGGRAWVTESAQTALGMQITYTPSGQSDASMGDAAFDAPIADTNPFTMGDVLDMDGPNPMTADGGSPAPDDPFIDRSMAFDYFAGSVAVVTRLRTELGPADLATDLLLTASPGQNISNQYNAAGPPMRCPQTTSNQCGVVGAGAPAALEGLAVAMLFVRYRNWRRRRKDRVS